VYGDDCAAAAPRIEHAQVLQPHLIERMAELGVVACIQPSFAVSDDTTARAALGRRFEHAYRWDMLLEQGVQIITGSDYPIEDLAPLVGLRDLSRVLPLETALELMTDSAAGTTVLSDDPRSVDPHDLPEIEVVDVLPSLDR
jgi:predicted amidohydrolase YtcJ